MSIEEYEATIKRSFERDYNRDISANMVVSSRDAAWLDQAKLTTPARIGPLLTLPARSLEISFQEIDAGSATDLQRHAHEAVHYVQQGSGYSEIGDRTFPWTSGDFIYTPPWTTHRHYSTGDETAKLLIIENSKLLEFLGVHQRESFGLQSWADHARLQQESRP